jgi:hypothetical protein
MQIIALARDGELNVLEFQHDFKIDPQAMPSLRIVE